MQSYRHLLVWQKAHALVMDAYRVTGSLPSTEDFGLTSQVRRSAVSVPSNIAEGSGRSYGREFARFLSHAAGSVSELEYQLYLCTDLGYLEPAESEGLQARCREVRKMLFALRRSLTTDN